MNYRKLLIETQRHVLQRDLWTLTMGGVEDTYEGSDTLLIRVCGAPYYRGLKAIIMKTLIIGDQRHILFGPREIYYMGDWRHLLH